MNGAAAAALLKSANARIVWVDVGAAGGLHGRANAIREYADFVGFDIDAAECQRLNLCARPGERFIHAAVGRDGERLTLELHEQRNTSSVYPTDRTRIMHLFGDQMWSPVAELQIETTSLDSLCARAGIPGIDYLKLDIEGHELAALEGCSLPFLFAEVEVDFHPFRKGMPLFDDVMRHMRQRGYLLMDLRRDYSSARRAGDLRNYGAKGFLMHGDALFIADPFRDPESMFGASPARAKLLALLCLYGYAAEALAVCDEWGRSGLMSESECQGAVRLIVTHERSHKVRGLRVARLLLVLERFAHLPFAMRTGLRVHDRFQFDGELGN